MTELTLKSITLPIELQLSKKSQALIDFIRGLESPAAPEKVSTPPTAQQSNTPPAHGEYWPDQGGHYICTLPALLGVPARHLIAGAAEAEDIAFGPSDDIAGARSQIDGPANTTALLSSGTSHPAAQWAAAYTADGHADFFLPARLDLVMAHICAPQLFKKSGWYWTSTQFSRSHAFVQDFESGDSDWSSKDSEHRVRAFRRVQLDALNT